MQMNYLCQRAIILGLWLLSGDAFHLHQPGQQDGIWDPTDDHHPDLLNAPMPWPIIDKSRLKNKRLPNMFRGQVVVLIGDSNDRNALQALCQMYDGYSYHIDPIFSIDESVPLHMLQCSDDRPLICNVDAYNFTAVQLWHFGAMSTKGQPYWHSWSLQDGDRSCMLPQFDNGTKLHESDHLVKTWYPRVIADIAMSRPTVVVAQSSLWDSVLLVEYLRQHGGKVPIAQGWSMMDGWIDHATELVQSISDSRIPFKQLCWRTNPNCPFESDHFIEGMSKLQAEAVRKMIADQQGPWAGVCLIDWQAEIYVEDRKKCDGLHYKTDAYEKLWNTAWEVIAKNRA